MTSAMSIFDKILSKSFSLEQVYLFKYNLVCSMGDLGPSQDVYKYIITLGLSSLQLISNMVTKASQLENQMTNDPIKAPLRSGICDLS